MMFHVYRHLLSYLCLIFFLIQLSSGNCQITDSQTNQQVYQEQTYLSNQTTPDHLEQFAFDRGTASLRDGEVEIFFSKHFRLLANPSSISLEISAWEIDPEQLVVIELTSYGFKIKDLKGIKGIHQLDWEAKAVCKGIVPDQLSHTVKTNPFSSIK